MNKKTQLLIGVFAVGAVAYWLLNRRKDKIFANAEGKGCQIYKGDGVSVGTRLTDGRIVVRSNNGTTLVCPIGQTSEMPTSGFIETKIK